MLHYYSDFLSILLIIQSASLVFCRNFNGGCQISISDLNPEPIIVKKPQPPFQQLQFLYPNNIETGKVHLLTGSEIIISCPGTHLIPLHSQNSSSIHATCLSNNTFLINNKRIYLNDVRCAKKIKSTIKQINKNCYSQTTTNTTTHLFQIGFQIDPNTFLGQIDACFDNATAQAVYVKHSLSKSIIYREHGIKRPNFLESSHYHQFGQRLSQLYSQKNQQKTINYLVGLQPNSTKYIRNNTMFLTRGHLAPKGDFIYAPQQLATFYYLNVAPQWSAFNSGSWLHIENAIRQLANKTKRDYTIFSGVHGFVRLPHEETGEQVPIYLHSTKIPVPAIFWKVVIDPVSQNGVALLGNNNPYEKEHEPLCEDVSTTLNWLSLRKGSAKNGAAYACHLKDFEKVIKVPDFHINNNNLLQLS